MTSLIPRLACVYTYLVSNLTSVRLPWETAVQNCVSRSQLNREHSGTQSNPRQKPRPNFCWIILILDHMVKVKVWTLVIAPLIWVRLVTSSALQSQKWQLIGMNQWCRSASHNFIHLLKRQHNYTQKNESEHLTNQQHETLKNAT